MVRCRPSLKVLSKEPELFIFSNNIICFSPAGGWRSAIRGRRGANCGVSFDKDYGRDARKPYPGNRGIQRAGRGKQDRGTGSLTARRSAWLNNDEPMRIPPPVLSRRANLGSERVGCVAQAARKTGSQNTSRSPRIRYCVKSCRCCSNNCSLKSQI